jgi:hypothetical protein
VLQNCTLQNGWCVTVPQLDLTASEPLSGYDILTIEGTLNGQTFACPYANCSVTLNEGDNDFAFWALSSWGDSSTMGTLSAKVDSISPGVGLDVSGSNGTNGWITSPAAISAFGADSGSGLAEASLSVDGGVWQSATLLTEGVYTVSVRAIDNAGNSSTSSTTISVDTTTPSLNVSINGTMGGSGWYKSTTQVSAVASDATSGVGTLEVSMDGGAYQVYTAPASFSDGSHSAQFKATDRAGNVTESAIQNFSVDTIPPEIFIPESWPLGETSAYTVQDLGSGLASLRVVIEDEDERFAKVAWNEEVSGEKFEGYIDWDGKFKDGTVALPGTYFAWIKSSDVAGNEYVALGRIIVPEPNSLLRLFQPQPASTNTPAQPSELFEDEDPLSPDVTPSTTVFGGSAAQSGDTTTQSLLLSTGTAASTAASSNVLWGATAAAVLGAATAYALDERRKRLEAEEAQRAAIVARIEEMEAQREAALQARKVTQWLEGQEIFNQQIEKARLNGASDEEIDNLKKISATQGLGEAVDATKSLTSSLERTRAEIDCRDLQEELNLVRKLGESKPAPQDIQEQLAGLAAYYEAMRQGEQEAAKPTWWETTWNKTVDWVDNNQILASVLTGIAVAAVTVAIVASAPITLTALVIGTLVATVATATLVTAGTIALNHTKDRPLTTNLVKNVLAGGGTAFLITGLTLSIAGGFVTQAMITVGNTVAAACASSPSALTACSHIGPVVDTVEQLELGVEMTVQMALGDQEGAAQTAIEYQLEAMDGGVPGNTIATELGEQLAKLGDNATELIAKHGDEIIPLLVKHGDDAVEVIEKYGDDGVEVLLKFGDESEALFSLIRQKDEQAIQVLKATDFESAEKLFTTLDEDVLDYAIKEGPDAVSVLSRWSDEALIQYGPELALRSGNDAKALRAIEDLVNSGPINPLSLTNKQQELINAIAENSTQYNEASQIVLGKWVDFDSGFAEVARNTGSAHYNPHPDMWNLLEDLGDEQRKLTAWLINEQVIQTGIEKGAPFEYTLHGINLDNLDTERNAIEAIWTGATDSEIMKLLKSDYMPVRMNELKELYEAGYQVSFDSMADTFIFIKP